MIKPNGCSKSSALDIDAFPELIRPYAKRQNFCGNGSETSPFIYGWSVRVAGTDLAYNTDAKTWFKANGFTYSGGKWLLRDVMSTGQ